MEGGGQIKMSKHILLQSLFLVHSSSYIYIDIIEEVLIIYLGVHMMVEKP